jgi:hypothetical protein
MPSRLDDRGADRAGRGGLDRRRLLDRHPLVVRLEVGPVRLELDLLRPAPGLLRLMRSLDPGEHTSSYLCAGIWQGFVGRINNHTNSIVLV